jgi:hypothetical protein
MKKLFKLFLLVAFMGAGTSVYLKVTQLFNKWGI